MIILNEEYIIDFDSLNITLYKRVNSKGSNRKIFNNNYYVSMGYFGEFNHLLSKLVKDKIFCDGNTFNTLQEIVTAIECFKNEVRETMYFVVKNKNIAYKGNP